MTSQAIARRDFLCMGMAAGVPAVNLSSARAKPAGECGSRKRLIVRSKSPCNAEPALGDLVRSWITPTEYFYVRNHAPVPKVDAGSFRLMVTGLVDRPLSLSLAELREKFPSASAVATMTCAGNRRSEHSRVKKVGGVQWAAGAIGNARWTGVRLSDVLRAAGVKPSARHVWFEGLDKVPRGGGTIGFGASVPVEKAFADAAAAPGTLLTLKMNGVPLPAEHGFPLRAVVPGYIGARSVKWLSRVVVSDRTSPNHYVSGAYKVVETNTPLEWMEAAPIYRFPINAVICTPADGAKPTAGRMQVTGYALAPGRPGRTIRQVQISADGGRTWTTATLHSPAREYCWQLWRAGIDLSRSRGKTTILVKATDSNGKVQPADTEWNYKGYLFNARHRVRLTLNNNDNR